MKRNLLLILGIAFTIFSLNAQTPMLSWAKSLGGSSSDQGKSVAVDA